MKRKVPKFLKTSTIFGTNVIIFHQAKLTKNKKIPTYESVKNAFKHNTESCYLLYTLGGTFHLFMDFIFIFFFDIDCRRNCSLVVFGNNN